MTTEREWRRYRSARLPLNLPIRSAVRTPTAAEPIARGTLVVISVSKLKRTTCENVVFAKNVCDSDVVYPIPTRLNLSVRVLKVVRLSNVPRGTTIGQSADKHRLLNANVRRLRMLSPSHMPRQVNVASTVRTWVDRCLARLASPAEHYTSELFPYARTPNYSRDNNLRVAYNGEPAS